VCVNERSVGRKPLLKKNSQPTFSLTPHETSRNTVVLNFVQSACFGIAAERQVRRMREKFLQVRSCRIE
jgi:hypothetical protein